MEIQKQTRQASRRKFHYVYKITCTVDNRWYIGIHSTDKLDDGYFGSGTDLAKSKRQYGLENHTMEILEFCESRDEIRKREAELITWMEVFDPDCMNKVPGGGSGSWEHANNLRLNCYPGKSTNEKVLSALDKAREVSGAKIADPEFNKVFRKKVSDALKETIAVNGSWWISKNHSAETKEKIGAKSAIHQAGEKNSQFGTMWISNLDTKESIRVKMDHVFENPWVKGRNAWKVVESNLAKLEQSKKKQEEKLKKLQVFVDAYHELKSLRLISEKFGISYVAVRAKLKQYEEITNTKVLNAHGARNT